MKNILGLGAAGSNVVKQLSGFSQYVSYTISTENKKTTKNDFSLMEHESPEEYEQSDTSGIDKFLSKIQEQLTVFLCGASKSTGLTLKILSPLSKRGVKIEIVYFMPEREILSEAKILQEKVVRNVLQQYSRSGLFEKIFLISNESLENITGNINVIDYFKQINSLFVNAYYMLDVFKNTKPITSTFSKLKSSCRIATIGLAHLGKEDSLFFPLKQEVEVVYYFGINEEKLRTEEGLFRTIMNKVKGGISNDRKVSFGIYSTDYEHDYIYTEYYSPKIQDLSLDKQEEI